MIRFITQPLLILWLAMTSVSFVSIDAFAQAVDSTSTTQILNRVTEFSKPKLFCEPLPKTETVQKKLSAASFPSLKCSDLTADHPPSWVRNAKTAGLFKNPDLWRPICSWVQIDEIKAMHPEWSNTQVVASLNRDTLRYDECGAPPKPKKKAGSEHHLLDTAQRIQKLQTIEDARQFVIPVCCGKDQDCIDLLKKVQVGFCENDPNAKETDDSCEESSTFYVPQYDKSKHWYRDAHAKGSSVEEVQKKLTGQFEIEPGSISVSPFFSNDDTVGDYMHEFGHACSQLKRSLAINRGSAPEFSEYCDEDECSAPMHVNQVYHKLVLDRGYNEDTFACINQRSAEAKKPKFHAKGCADACPRSYLEESYADLFSSTVFKTTRMVPELIPQQLCRGIRDEEHMLTSDIVGCMLKTPAVKTAIEIESGCMK